MKKEKKMEQKQKPRQKKLVDKASVFVGADLSRLSKRELQIVSVLLENPTATYEEIGNKIGMVVNQVGGTLCSARKKVLGTYEVKEETRKRARERARKKARENPEEVREKKKKYYNETRDKWLDYMREYNKKYYAENRERILQKQKEKKSKEQ